MDTNQATAATSKARYGVRRKLNNSKKEKRKNQLSTIFPLQPVTRLPRYRHDKGALIAQVFFFALKSYVRFLTGLGAVVSFFFFFLGCGETIIVGKTDGGDNARSSVKTF